ncbi:hypothetical protein [Bacillus cihuensis]|uniref:hypothetical protein n=1 Tax=Bacillus cihuensis TaxID=1208599 RepID=UPI00048FDD3E|nr:hypothetical protein [Bacillus cihuensis]
MVGNLMLILLLILSGASTAVGISEAETSRSNTCVKWLWHGVFPSFLLFLMTTTIYLILVLSVNGQSIMLLYGIFSSGLLFFLFSLIFLVSIYSIKWKNKIIKIGL